MFVQTARLNELNTVLKFESKDELLVSFLCKEQPANLQRPGMSRESVE